MSYSRVAVVTGGNKGIGYAIVRHLALDYPRSGFNNGRLLIYLTARDKSRGEEALRSLATDAQLKKASALIAAGGLTDVKFHALDITDSGSIQAFSKYLKNEHPDGIDIAVNNAGIAGDGFDSKVVETVLQTNYYGTLEASEALLALLRPGGRLVNVASMLGRVTQYPTELQSAFHAAAAESTPDAATTLMRDFAAAVASGDEGTRGWPRSAYSVSKAGCIAMTKALAQGERRRNRGVLVNAVCPGYIRTDLTKGRGAGEPDQGAQTPVHVALGDIGEVTGKFWKDRRVCEW